MQRVRRFIEHSGAAKAVEPSDADGGSAAFLAISGVGHARQAVGNALKAEIAGRCRSVSEAMTDSMQVAEPKVVQRRRAEGAGPPCRQRVIVGTEDLFAL